MYHISHPLRVKVASALEKTDLDLFLPSELVNNDVIVKGKAHKMQILQEYKAEFELTTQDQSSQREKVSALVNRIL